MNGLEITVLLGVVVLAAAVLAPRLHMAPPLLLFWESPTTSLRAIKRDFRGIVIMSTLLVVATALGIAGLTTALGMPWGAALVLGSALAPPDATAAAALARTLPRRQFMLLKAERLTNDGTALVLYAIAVARRRGAATPHSTSRAWFCSRTSGESSLARSRQRWLTW